MKSKEWAKQYEQYGFEKMAEMYMEETKKLIDQRTRYSDAKSRALAVDGAVREQKQKWDAVCRAVPNGLTASLFDDMVGLLHANPKGEQEGETVVVEPETVAS